MNQGYPSMEIEERNFEESSRYEWSKGGEFWLKRCSNDGDILAKDANGRSNATHTSNANCLMRRPSTFMGDSNGGRSFGLGMHNGTKSCQNSNQ